MDRPRCLLCLGILALVLAAPAPRAQAPVPTTISYQGLLTTAAGTPVPDGAYTVTLRLFPVAVGGSAVYAESHSVTTTGGVFSTELGGGTPVTGVWSTVSFNEGYWLEVAVGGTTLSQRTKLLTVPYARALTLPYTGITDANVSAFTISTTGPLAVYGESNNSAAGTGVLGVNRGSTGSGVFGQAEATTGQNYGVYGVSESTSGRGVSGWAEATTGTTYGGEFFNLSTSGRGIYARATASTGTTYGVYGEATSTSGRGVYGQATATSGTTYGVFGTTASTAGRAVYGSATATTGTNYAIFGTTGSASGYAGYFNGRAHVTGTLSKGGGSFEIDHPLDPEYRVLRHSFVESPDMMNVYNGNVTTDARGEAVIELPEWFEALNRDFRYQLTTVESFSRAMVAERIQGNRFVIRTEEPNVEVSWQVTGIRHDAWAEENRIVVEEDKPAAQRGRYLHPSAFGQPRERGVDYDPELEAEQARLDGERARRDEELRRHEAEQEAQRDE